MAEKIELVIKIPKYYLTHPQDYSCLAECVRRGVPLPKGHGKLIDADETISKICGNLCGCHLEECGHDKPCDSVARIIEALTIVEADTENRGKK